MARSVLATAGPVAKLLGATVEPVHVVEDGDSVVRAEAAAAGLSLREIDGPVVKSLVVEAGDEDVVGMVLGSRTERGDPRPAGSTALTVITSAEKPVAVVPPGVPPREELATMLVPLDGTTRSASAIWDVVRCACEGDTDVVVLHVLQEDSAPMFADQPMYEAEAWLREFMARFCPTDGATPRVRFGVPSDEVMSVAEEVGADLIALGWSQDMSPGRAAVVRRCLAEARLPILLVPVEGKAA
jgi:nucleotide-binding universal stress UspA family protein